MPISPAPVVIAAPGSLAPVREALTAGFAAAAPPATLRFGEPAYSGVLAAAILAGAPAEVFISANLRYMRELKAAGLVPAPAILARNALSLVVRADLAAQVQKLSDVFRPGWRLAIPPAATDPLGEYIGAMIDSAGLTDRLAAKRARGEVPEALPRVPALFAAGELEAAIVYRTAMAALAPAAVPVPLPAALTMAEQITFAVGAIARGGDPRPEATQVVAYLLGDQGQAILMAAGFLPDPRIGTWADPEDMSGEMG